MAFKMAFKSFLRFLRTIIDILGIFYDVLQTISYLGGGSVTIVGATLFRSEVPKIIPIALIVVGICLLLLGTVRAVIRYRIWLKIKNDPILDEILKKLLQMHLRLGKIRENVTEGNRKKNIKTKVRNGLANQYLNTLDLTNEVLVRYIEPDGSFKKGLYKRLRRIYHLRENEYLSMLQLLNDFSRMLNRSGLGLRSEMSKEYSQMNSELLELQLKLDIPDADTHLVQDLKQFSVGLQNLAIGADLINPSSSWFNSIPDSWKNQQDDMPVIIERVYMRVSSWVRTNLKRTMFLESLK